MVKGLFKRYIDFLGFQPWTIWVYRVWEAPQGESPKDCRF